MKAFFAAFVFFFSMVQSAVAADIAKTPKNRPQMAVMQAGNYLDSLQRSKSKLRFSSAIFAAVEQACARQSEAEDGFSSLVSLSSCQGMFDDRIQDAICAEDQLNADLDRYFGKWLSKEDFWTEHGIEAKTVLPCSEALEQILVEGNKTFFGFKSQAVKAADQACALATLFVEAGGYWQYNHANWGRSWSDRDSGIVGEP